MKRNVLILLVSIAAFLVSMIVGGIIIMINGDNPVVAYGALIQGAFSSMDNLANTLSSATPLIFTGLGVSIAFKAGVANIGAEGQLYIGGMAAAIVGIYAPFPKGTLLPAALLAAFVFGGIYGMIPAALKIKTGTNEVVTTLMLNYVATLFTSYLVNYPLKAPKAPIGMTRNIQEAAKLPVIYPGTRFNMGFILAIIAIIILAIYFKYRPGGYEMRMIGDNAEFAKYSGIQVNGRVMEAMFIGGGLAGLGGAAIVLGVQYRFVQDISPGYGFDGLTIALMSCFNPVIVLPMATLFGALRSGGLSMELMTRVPSELSTVIQAVVILFMAAQGSITTYINEIGTRLRFRREKSSEGRKNNV